MADFEHKEGGMSIFKNDRKERENQPDYTGSALIDGKKKQISCWLNEGKNGNKYFSCKVQDPYVNPSNNTSQQQSAINNDFDDDVPF
ncbi:hypothetical protein KAR91_48000 [Candidatus Pacearchaeota archaeon]|nr:hypothetical protein [Candidatus Pacearchaeota archaeon]